MKSSYLIGISRHRIGVDGEGVTTLVAYHRCPLRCQYCLNPKALSPNGVWKRYTPEELYNHVKQDDLYFRATGGGMTFGGGWKSHATLTPLAKQDCPPLATI